MIAQGSANRHTRIGAFSDDWWARWVCGYCGWNFVAEKCPRWLDLSGTPWRRMISCSGQSRRSAEESTIRIAESIADVHHVTNRVGERTDVIVPLFAWEALLALLEEMAERLEDQEDVALLTDWLHVRADGYRFGEYVWIGGESAIVILDCKTACDSTQAGPTHAPFHAGDFFPLV